MTDAAAAPHEGLLEVFRRKRHVWQARRAKAVSAALATPDTFVKIVGRIDGENTLRAPLTQASCVAFCVRVDAKTTVIRTRRFAYESSAPVFREELSRAARTAFWIVDDADRRVFVEDGPTTLLFDFANVNEHAHVNDENPDFAAFLRSGGILPTQYMGIAGDHQFFEATVSSGQRVAIYGKLVATSEVVASGYRESVETRRVLRGDAGRPIVIFPA